jgi:hypothetical protein
MNAHAQTSADPGRAHSLRLAVLLATYMQSANLPLPNAVLRLIQGTLSMTDDQAGWIFTAYLAASAITLPIAQWLAGRLGLKLVYQAALAVFVLGLLLATVATTPLQFIGARIIQGLASGVLAPLSMAIAMETLAPDLLHQPTVVGVHLFGRGPATGREKTRESAFFRLLRFRQFHPGLDRPADAARPRRTPGLVRFAGNLDRGTGLWVGVVLVHGARIDQQDAFPQQAPVP